MKVNIQYGIDIEEVPKKISDLVTDSLDRLQEKIDITRSLVELCSRGAFLESMETGLDDLRRELTTVDNDIASAHSICSGLIQHLSPDPAPIPQPPQPPTQSYEDPEPVTETVEQPEEELNEDEQHLDTDKG
jgi:hypothetical protein